MACPDDITCADQTRDSRTRESPSPQGCALACLRKHWRLTAQCNSQAARTTPSGDSINPSFQLPSPLPPLSRLLRHCLFQERLALKASHDAATAQLAQLKEAQASLQQRLQAAEQVAPPRRLGTRAPACPCCLLTHGRKRREQTHVHVMSACLSDGVSGGRWPRRGDGNNPNGNNG